MCKELKIDDLGNFTIDNAGGPSFDLINLISQNLDNEQISIEINNINLPNESKVCTDCGQEYIQE